MFCSSICLRFNSAVRSIQLWGLGTFKRDVRKKRVRGSVSKRGTKSDKKKRGEKELYERPLLSRLPLLEYHLICRSITLLLETVSSPDKIKFHITPSTHPFVAPKVSQNFRKMLTSLSNVSHVTQYFLRDLSRT